MSPTGTIGLTESSPVAARQHAILQSFSKSLLAHLTAQVLHKYGQRLGLGHKTTVRSSAHLRSVACLQIILPSCDCSGRLQGTPLKMS